MATLQWRPRRSKSNPYPLALAPLARWERQTKYGTDHLALRANGTIVIRRARSKTYNVARLTSNHEPPYYLDEVVQLVESHGWVRIA